MKEEYVDLGLPSGILWAKHSVCVHKRRHFTHSQAVEIARDLHCELPSKENFEELINLCKWKWMKLFGKVTGYKVTGPNGNYIFLSASGLNINNSPGGRGSFGYYWSAIYYDSCNAYSLHFYSGDHYMYCNDRRCEFSVRTVKIKCS